MKAETETGFERLSKEPVQRNRVVILKFAQERRVPVDPGLCCGPDGDPCP